MIGFLNNEKLHEHFLYVLFYLFMHAYTNKFNINKCKCCFKQCFIILKYFFFKFKYIRKLAIETCAFIFILFFFFFFC